MVAPDKVADVACGHRQYLTPDGQANPESSAYRNQANIVNFLIAATYAYEQHLVYTVPQVTIDIQVEGSDFTCVIDNASLYVHGKGVRR